MLRATQPFAGGNASVFIFMIIIIIVIFVKSPAACALAPSNSLNEYQAQNGYQEKFGRVRVEFHGQIIENLFIVYDGFEPAIEVDNFDDVVIRNVKVRHHAGPGIAVRNSANTLIQNVDILNTSAPIYGPNTGLDPASRVNIVIENADDIVIRDVYLEKGSSGVYALNSKNLKLFDIVGFDFRGPFPRGQLVQFDKCYSPLIDGFYVINPGDTSWSEDVVNSYSSLNPSIRNGYIEGVNSPSGIGVIIENDEGGWGGLVENIDVRFWVNGAFSAAGRSRNVTFRNVRAYDGLALAAVSDNAGKRASDGKRLPTLEEWAGRNFRGGPLSGQEAFQAFQALLPGSIEYRYAGYFNRKRRRNPALPSGVICPNGRAEGGLARG